MSFKGPLKCYREIRQGNTTLERTKEEQKKNKSEFSKIVNGGKKSENQRSAINNVKTLYESREKPIKLFDDYSSIVSEAKYNKIMEKV